MMKRVLLLSALLSAPLVAQEEQLLQNPDFELGTANDPAPGWKITPPDAVKLVEGEAVRGNKAVALVDGYGALTQDLSIPNLPGATVTIEFHARSTNRAHLGVRVGFSVSTDNGTKWHDRPLTWDRPLSEEFTPFSFKFTIPDNAVGERLWIGFYRSKKSGEIILDDIQLQLTPKP